MRFSYTTTKRLKMKCIKWDYEWESRKENPKACPRCKTRLDWPGGMPENES